MSRQCIECEHFSEASFRGGDCNRSDPKTGVGVFLKSVEYQRQGWWPFDMMMGVCGSRGRFYQTKPLPATDLQNEHTRRRENF